MANALEPNHEYKKTKRIFSNLLFGPTVKPVHPACENQESDATADSRGSSTTTRPSSVATECLPPSNSSRPSTSSRSSIFSFLNPSSGSQSSTPRRSETADPESSSLFGVLKAVCAGSAEVAFVNMMKAMQNGTMRRLMWGRKGEVGKVGIDEDVSGLSLDPALEIPSAKEVRKEFDGMFENMQIDLSDVRL
ncbi:hypothetical protein HDU98_009003 [Podochytrium sp. JEL0797]|nr:hypothetical protein HDU98_009003 [Podochytrium sp. JEL0797]